LPNGNSYFNLFHFQTAHMKKTAIISVLALAVVTLVGCSKNNNDPAPNTNPIVIPIQTTVQTTVSLGQAANLAVLAGSSVTNTGATNISGDLGLSPGTSIIGFPPGVLIGTIHINDATATQAKLDVTTAYDDLAGRTSTDMVTLSGNLGGLTLTPGLYKSTSSLAISSGDLTFDAKGNANAVFIIQIASTLTTTAGRQVILSGGALASNIFWQVGTSATFGTTSVLKGTILAKQSITFNTGATLDGRAFASIGTITMAGNTITKQ
jgi:Ice-binding-like